MRNRRHDRVRRAGLAMAGLLAAGLALAGCRGDRTAEPPRQFFPGLDDQPKYEAQERSTFYEEYEPAEPGEPRWGRTARPLVAGTVPYGRDTHFRSLRVADGRTIDLSMRDTFLKADPRLFEGRIYQRADDGTPLRDDQGARVFEYVSMIPAEIEVNEEFIALGEENFKIYCIACHGGTGAGDGLVGRRWAYPLPNFHDAVYQRGGDKGQDGYIFHTILNGVDAIGLPWDKAMRGYRGKVDEREAWAIVAYIRVLQKTRRGGLDDLTNFDRQRLEDRRPEAPPADGAAEQPATGGGA